MGFQLWNTKSVIVTYGLIIISCRKNPWEGRAYLETLHDLPGRLSDASSFSSERICSCQGGGFLQPSNYLNALPSLKKIMLLAVGEKGSPCSFNPGSFHHERNFMERHVEKLCCLCASHLRVLVDVKAAERNLMKIWNLYKISGDFSLEIMLFFLLHLLKDNSSIALVTVGQNYDANKRYFTLTQREEWFSFFFFSSFHSSLKNRFKNMVLNFSRIFENIFLSKRQKNDDFLSKSLHQTGKHM